MPKIKLDIRGATLIVAASDSLHPNMANYPCSGVNDHLVIQAALDALPATGGEVFLLDGTYNIEVSLVLDSYQTLRGCGRNTILTTTTAGVTIITATGAFGTEKVGITIADLCVDGNAGGVVNNYAIYWNFVDHSSVYNVWLLNNGFHGIRFNDSDHNRIEANTSSGNTMMGMVAGNDSFHNIISGNIVQGNLQSGIEISDRYNIVNGNTCQGNGWEGIYLAGGADYCTIEGNICEGSGENGIRMVGADHSAVINNTIVSNSQSTDNLYDGILLDNCDYNHIQGNTIRAGPAANNIRYAINISNATCDKNLVSNNDLYDDGFGTGAFNDVGTLTHVEDNNRGISIDQIKMFRQMKNTSGVQRVAGDVVSLKAVAAGNEVTAPAAIGERQVYGMVAETIADTAWGLVQVKGKTTDLKGTNVGGGNIVIGDNLITENGVRARKAAAATDPIFARAVEALAAADGVIDAYIHSPWD